MVVSPHVAVLRIVMPGLVPGIHAEPPAQRVRGCTEPLGVDGRDKPGHDAFLSRIYDPTTIRG